MTCRLPSLTLRKGLPCGFAWLGRDFFVFSGCQKQRFGIFPGCSFAMAWAQNLLGFCFSACVSQSDGPGVLFRYDVGAIPVEDFGPFSLFLVGSKSNVSAKATFRDFSGCSFAMAWAQNLLGFCFFACASQTPFS